MHILVKRVRDDDILVPVVPAHAPTPIHPRRAGLQVHHENIFLRGVQRGVDHGTLHHLNRTTRTILHDEPDLFLLFLTLPLEGTRLDAETIPAISLHPFLPPIFTVERTPQVARPTVIITAGKVFNPAVLGRPIERAVGHITILLGVPLTEIVDSDFGQRFFEGRHHSRRRVRVHDLAGGVFGGRPNAMHMLFVQGIPGKFLHIRLLDEDCLIQHQVGDSHVLGQLPLIHEQAGATTIESAHFPVSRQFLLDAAGETFLEGKDIADGISVFDPVHPAHRDAAARALGNLGGLIQLLSYPRGHAKGFFGVRTRFFFRRHLASIDLIHHLFPEAGIIPGRKISAKEIDAETGPSGLGIMAVDAMILNERPDIGWHWHDRLSGEQTECTNEQTGRLRQETMEETRSHGVARFRQMGGGFQMLY